MKGRRFISVYTKSQTHLCFYRAMLCCRKMSVRLSVCLSHAGIVAIRLNISPNLFHHR